MEKLNKFIKHKYGSINKFVNKIGMPYSTYKSIMARDLKKATVENLYAITKELDIDLVSLIAGEIKQSSVSVDGITLDEKDLLDRYRLLDKEKKDLVKKYADFIL